MFRTWLPLLMVIYSEMRKLHLSYLMQSECGREWHSTSPERWVQENTNICWALWVDVTFFSMPFQSQILKLLPTQASPAPASPWPLFLLGLFLLMLTITISTIWARARIIKIFVVRGEKEPSLKWKKLIRRKKMKKVDETNIPAPAPLYPTPPWLAFQSLPNVLMFSPSFFTHCNLF